MDSIISHLVELNYLAGTESFPISNVLNMPLKGSSSSAE